MTVLHFATPATREEIEEATLLLATLLRQDRGRVTVSAERKTHLTCMDVVRWVSLQTGVTVETIVGPLRHHAAFRTRAAAVWGARKILHMSFPQIGRRFGDRDHSTIIASVRRAEEMRARDPAFRSLTDRMLATFAPKGEQ